MKLTCAACCLVWIAAASATADTILFNNDPGLALGSSGVTIGGGTHFGNAGENYAMEFTPTASGTVTSLGIAAWCNSASTPCAVYVSLAANNGEIPGSLLTTTPVLLSGFTYYGNAEEGTVSSGPYLSAGTSYWAIVSAENPLSGYLDWFRAPGPPGTIGSIAEDGDQIGSGAWSTYESWAVTLDVEGTAGGGTWSGVPEPAQIFWLPPALLILVGIYNRVVKA